ncbi:MAG: hypothetical protein ABR505_01375 [Actinomycetota bacterium]
MIERRLFTELRMMDRHDLRRVLIFVRGLLVSLGDDDVVQPDPEDAVTYRLEHVTCGKPGCKRCPHGPYWYAYYREDGRLRSRYIGKVLAEDVSEAEKSLETD